MTLEVDGADDCTDSCCHMTPVDLLEEVELHLVERGQAHDGSIVAELEWLAERILALATAVERYGVHGPCPVAVATAEVDEPIRAVS